MNEEPSEEWVSYQQGIREGRKESEARIEQLEAALKPFADACDDAIDEDDSSDASAWESAAAMAVTIRDFRKARAALNASKENRNDRP